MKFRLCNLLLLLTLIASWSCFLGVESVAKELPNIPAVHDGREELHDKFSKEFIKTFQEMYFQGNGEAAANFFSQELMWKRDSRKEVEISCPSQETPIVSIRSIDEKENNLNQENEEFEIDLDENGNPYRKKLDHKIKECLTIKLTGKNFDFSFAVDCPV